MSVREAQTFLTALTRRYGSVAAIPWEEKAPVADIATLRHDHAVLQQLLEAGFTAEMLAAWRDGILTYEGYLARAGGAPVDWVHVWEA